MDVLVMVGQLFLSLSILVVLHELGHFVPAKLFGAKVEKFYLFFDPWFELFKFKKGDTEYGIGWLPLGGYVKIAGMIDESFDQDQMSKEPQPWEFRSKPAWQRMIIMIGGVTVNFILGFFIWAMVLYTWGQDILPAESAKYGIEADSMAQALGLRNGDIITGVNSEPITNFSALRRDIIIKQAKTIQVTRNGNAVDVPVSREHLIEMGGYRGDFVLPRFPFLVDTVLPNSASEKAGITKGDRIIGVNDQSTPYFYDFVKSVRKLKNEEATIAVLRNSDTLQLNATISEEGKIGAGPPPLNQLLDFKHVDYEFAASLPAGFNRGVQAVGDMITSFGLMFSGSVKAKDSLGSFITIGKLFSGYWDWKRFWTLTALLSLVLGFMNFLPIPLLDGGHVMFLLYEMITGRPPNEKFQEIAHLIGLVLIVSLMIFAIGLDIGRELGLV